MDDSEDASDAATDNLELGELGGSALAGDLSNTELHEVVLEGRKLGLKLLGGLGVEFLSLDLDYSWG